MNKLVYLTASILALSSITSNADTLSSVLNDIQNNMIVVEKTGACDRNPNLGSDKSDPKTGMPFHSLKPCKPVVAQCPSGTTLVPGLSKCSMAASSKDNEILSVLKKINGDYITKLTSPIGWGEVITSKTLMGTKNQQQCDVDSSGFGMTTGYTPFCFFDLSKVETLESGEYPFFVSAGIDGGLVKLRNASSAYPYSQNITLSEFNNASNYSCYAVTVKATARCLAIPDGFLKKLGLTDIK